MKSIDYCVKKRKGEIITLLGDLDDDDLPLIELLELQV
jgi:hypothetical protein